VVTKPREKGEQLEIIQQQEVCGRFKEKQWRHQTSPHQSWEPPKLCKTGRSQQKHLILSC